MVGAFYFPFVLNYIIMKKKICKLKLGQEEIRDEEK